MKKYAIIKNGIVSNVAVADSPDGLNYPDADIVDIVDIGDSSVGQGYIFSSGEFSAPPKSKDEESADAYQLKMRLVSTAREIISTLQADLLLGEISDDDKARLIEWRAYLKKLEDINAQDAPGISWPVPPEV